MLRTTLPTSAARSAYRSLQASRLVLRTPQTITQRTFTTTQPTRSKPSFSTGFTFSSHQRPSTSSLNSTILRRLRSSLRFFHNSRARPNGKPTSPNPTPNLGSPGVAEAEPTSLSARLKKLSREYGWSAFGVYMMLTALDFPFCYLLVRSLGTDRIGEWEHIIISNIKRFIPESVRQTWHDWRASMKEAEQDVTGGDQVSEHIEMAGWGVKEAEKANKAEASLATQLALAYAIHKSFIFIRVPLTVAITPRVVKVLRGWGWDIGKRTTKEAKALKRAALPPRAVKK